MNDWLAAAPHAQVAHGALGCAVSINDMADRPPRPLADGEVLDIGGHRLRQLPTPHVPHNWEAQLMFDETTSTLFCGDLFTQVGCGPALVHDADMITPAMSTEDIFMATSLGPLTVTTIRHLAELAPRTLALMHGPSATGACDTALHDLADGYAARLALSRAA
jgi:flavorubredoxin